MNFKRNRGKMPRQQQKRIINPWKWQQQFGFAQAVDQLFANWDAVVSRLAQAGCRPSSTLLGVSRLAFPELLIEIEATAVK
jgi:enamine deaminase RidA (YjgF/YER057c/UK114 family)